jgi:hypothetical protein
MCRWRRDNGSIISLHVNGGGSDACRLTPQSENELTPRRDVIFTRRATTRKCCSPGVVAWPAYICLELDLNCRPPSSEEHVRWSGKETSDRRPVPHEIGAKVFRRDLLFFGGRSAFYCERSAEQRPAAARTHRNVLFLFSLSCLARNYLPRFNGQPATRLDPWAHRYRPPSLFHLPVCLVRTESDSDRQSSVSSKHE